ncbi:MAG: alginate export family protein [Candidatus Hydrogenedentes bacterium]|nr:alginate export family protein [Candidatus Hydrogenedentota bacterium]
MMIKARGYLSFIIFLFLAFETLGELQSVSVGGELRIRGRWYINTFAPREERIPPAFLIKRPVGGDKVTSMFKWDNEGSDWSRYETSVLLNFKADFTDDITAFIEFYDFYVGGEDFRSKDYVTGVDTRAESKDDVEIEQAYIEVRNIFDMPITVKIGRQDLIMGKGWLVTNMLTPSQYSSQDSIRLTYKEGNWTLDAFASKLAERYNVEQDGDIDFYGVYGTYSGWKPLSLSAYWYFLRDGLSPHDTKDDPVLEFMEDLLNRDDYGVTRLHTVGIRAFGKYSSFDYDLELAYQFGDADSIGARFKPIGGFLYGDDDASWGDLGAELTLGYTFQDVKWTPRIYTLGVYFQGHDNRDISFWDWINPFYEPEASHSFNRLFSDRNYLPTVNDNGWLSNYWQVQLGFELKPTEKILFHFHGAYDGIVSPFDPPKSFKIFGRKFYALPFFSFWTEEGEDDIGWELAAWIRYNYSKDLWFMLYGNYLFVGDGLAQGAYIQGNGTDFAGGTDDDNAGYIFWMSVLKF